ncbi:N-acetylmuramoyl-L-alanine amidase family protein [Candidatus Azobacteroides pseudotrichonymphae]|uniref:N-acetylmuramoyl-L-alanine amidase n=1 Tax=Azobacteroides pseudotrichonymphae genomovar. CFP2 TaxID=511995 RepID=B6YR67_AZOPC|nr:N-acetylmuramoyl-L-alanine amidase [Candidatus Azobacteroides pseudotrichonymphae]BAG83689.1 N-acetylmuramoyl-L-alanine amidase [Candidatus Azobacteroides pseudotrichonymphae genomovar. CFP2]
MSSKQSLCIVFLFFTFSMATLSFAAKKESFILVIDAGHGGKDPGAISKGKGSKEKDITLAVALLTGKYITAEHENVKVIYTRDKDESVDLWKRAEIANKSKANLFISIHTNASTNTNVHGSEVYAFGVSRTKENLEIAKRENSVIYYESNYRERYEGFDPNVSESYIIFEFMQNKFVYQSLDFALSVQSELKSCVPWPERGIKQAEYLVLRKTSMPRILIELDFITNPEAEMYLLSEDGQKRYARAICNAFTKHKISYYDHKK